MVKKKQMTSFRNIILFIKILLAYIFFINAGLVFRLRCKLSVMLLPLASESVRV